MPERQVRFTHSFFDQLDVLLPAERGADGSPSATDFLLYELPRIRDLLAADFERTRFQPMIHPSGSSSALACW